MAQSSQKFIGRNRPPRVQIEYDVELYGAEKKVQIPFVMGVMADLAGKPRPDEPITPVLERKFLDIDADNFTDRLEAMRPHAAFRVPNTITGEGEIPVDLTFKSLDDFSPDAIARNVDGLKQLLEARTQLDTLLTQMDGKTGAEDLIVELIQDESLQKALTSVSNSTDESPDEQSSESEE